MKLPLFCNIMKILSLLVWIIAFFFFTELNGVKCEPSNHIDMIIKDLDETIFHSQATTSEKKGRWIFEKGLYDSWIKFNFHGSRSSRIMRDMSRILDNNPFTTMWISIMLLEAAGVKNGSVPTDQQLNHALEAVSTYHDKNSPEGDGMMVYWSQEKNESANEYYCRSENINIFVDTADELFRIVLKFTTSKELVNIISNIQQYLDNIKTTSKIPPDFDDSFVNIGLGSLLSTYSATKKPFQLWKDKNSKFTQIFAALKKYAYRPFSTDVSGFISPASYFYLRKYLHSIDNHYPAAFVKTWAQTISEEYKSRYTIGMPNFLLNDIDINVGANVIYGISSLLLTDTADTQEWFDDDVQAIYENTTNLIAWMIHRNFSNRRDLAMPYYCSIYNFYWFTSRTFSLLQTYNANNSFPYPALLTKIMDTLSPVLRGAMTTDLLQRAKHETYYLLYFEDFLGIDDGYGNGEDILCSTAMAINALLNTWTFGGEFVPDVPSSVKETIKKASLWLLRNVKNPMYKPDDALFSPASKSSKDIPYFYPANKIMYLNGSTVPEGANITDDLLVGVQSMIPEEEYQDALKMKHFGHDTPQDFHGYNDYTFPFFTSGPFTYAVAKLALTQYKALLTSGQLTMPELITP